MAPRADAVAVAPAAAPAGFVISDVMAVVLALLATAGAALDRPLLAVLGALVLVLALLARVWTRLALEGVHYACATSSASVFEGDEVLLTLTLENRKPLPLAWLRVREQLPPGLELEDREATAAGAFGATVLLASTGLAGHQRLRLRYRLRARRRGHYVLGPARLTSGDPFGFYETERVVLRAVATLTVYPRLPPPRPPDLALAHPIGDRVARVRSVDDPTLPVTVREYRAGDDARAIDWKVTARRAAPWVRVNDASVSGCVVLLLECDTRVRGVWDDAPELLEALVRTTAGLARDLLAHGHAVGLVANGVPPGDQARVAVAPGAGPQQLPLLLDALARVQPLVVKPLAALVEEHAGRVLPFGASVVCVTGRLRPETGRMLAARAHHGARTLVLHVGDAPPPSVPGVRVRHVAVAP